MPPNEEDDFPSIPVETSDEERFRRNRNIPWGDLTSEERLERARMQVQGRSRAQQNLRARQQNIQQAIEERRQQERARAESERARQEQGRQREIQQIVEERRRRERIFQETQERIIREESERTRQEQEARIAQRTARMAREIAVSQRGGTLPTEIEFGRPPQFISNRLTRVPIEYPDYPPEEDYEQGTLHHFPVGWWCMRNGWWIILEDIRDSHLMSLIRYFRKAGADGSEKFRELNEELERRNRDDGPAPLQRRIRQR
jgi:hypothetical protein